MASIICQALGRGFQRSKLQWLRKAAENGYADACIKLAAGMYRDDPYAREVGRMVEAAVVATSAGVTEGHDLPPDVMTDVVHWLRKVCATGQRDPLDMLEVFRKIGQRVGTSRHVAHK
jgi:TPR repeat protein